MKTLEATFLTYFKQEPLTDGFSVEGNLIYAPVQAEVNTRETMLILCLGIGPPGQIRQELSHHHFMKLKLD